jgi:protoporphyrinogen/coproporphyrinogen III oxidase
VELAPAMSARVAAEGGQGRLDGYVRDDVRALFPTLDRDVAGIAEQWWDEMLPEWYPGYARRMAAFVDAQRSGPRTIYFCGDYLSQSHTGGACASGRAAARLVGQHWPR